MRTCGMLLSLLFAASTAADPAAEMAGTWLRKTGSGWDRIELGTDSRGAVTRSRTLFEVDEDIDWWRRIASWRIERDELVFEFERRAVSPCPPKRACGADLMGERHRFERKGDALLVLHGGPFGTEKGSYERIEPRRKK